jgi:hypothetical protein
MAKTKGTPNLPGSSRMQMPAGSNGTSSIIKEKGGMTGGSKGATKKVMALASKGKSAMKSSNPYC